MGYIMYNGTPYCGSDESVDTNLLANSDFRKVFNKSGATSYQSTGWANNTPSINRWVLKGASGHAKLTINESSVTASASPEIGHFRQIFGITIPEDDYTITVNVLNLTGTVNVYAGDDSFTSEAQPLTVGKNVIHVHGSLNYVNISLTAGSSVELEWMKLERGTESTDFNSKPTPLMVAIMSL